MKKILITLLTMCALASTAAAAPARDAADEGKAEAEAVQVVDLSGYDDETLLDLMRQVQAEVAARHIEATAQLRAGTYIFGQDIPVGKYVLAKAEESQDAGMIELLAADGETRKLYVFVGRDESYEAYLVAEEGDTLMVEFPGTLTISAGVTFQ